MSQNQKNVNGFLERLIECTMTAYDNQLAIAEEQFRQAIGMADDTPEEMAYLESIGAWADMWQSAVKNAYWAGYKLGQDEK